MSKWEKISEKNGLVLWECQNAAGNWCYARAPSDCDSAGFVPPAEACPLPGGAGRRTLDADGRIVWAAPAPEPSPPPAPPRAYYFQHNERRLAMQQQLLVDMGRDARRPR